MTTSRRVFSFDIGIRHLALADITCTVSVNEGEDNTKPAQMHRWDILPLVADDVKVKHVSLETIAEALYATLDEWYPHGDIDNMPDTVFIENQPALKNPMMKSVQMLVYGYFTGRRIWMVEGGLRIQLISASQKLKWAQKKGYVPVLVAATHSSKRYTATKRAAVASIEAVLPALFTDSEALLSQFRASKKKDDLADCLLQGLSCLL